MGEETSIAWTQHTFNPWIGCMKVSPGCKHCYAETLITGRMGRAGLWGPNSSRARTAPGNWRLPIRWNKAAAQAGTPERTFSGSLCDVFEGRGDTDAILPDLWALIRETPFLHWQLLTKRPENIRDRLPLDWGARGEGYANVWLGTSVENQEHAWRAATLAALPARVRFISYEPALGPLHLVPSVMKRLDWIIYGGESGPGFRADNHEWATDLEERCRDSGTAFFYKQKAARRSGERGFATIEQVRNYPTPRATVIR